MTPRESGVKIYAMHRTDVGRFIKLILLSSIVVLLMSTLAAVADPIQGFAEQIEIPTRIQRPADSLSIPVIPNNTEQAKVDPLVRDGQFGSLTPSVRLPVAHQAIISGTRGGQDEYWVSWDAWRSRIADAVWGPLKERRTTMWGMTRVDYDVTRDHHIQITSVRTPDPSGKSGKVLVSAIMQLDNSPILAFPSGSQQTIHHNYNMDMGMPMPGRVHYTIHLRGGKEHVVNQW